MTITTNRRKHILFLVCCIAVVWKAEHARADETFIVDSTVDLVDDNPGDGICHTAQNSCTLRAAVMEANRAFSPIANILLSAGTYILTIPYSYAPSETDGALFITRRAPGSSVVSLQGAGAGSTIIDGNQDDSVIQVRQGSASINGVTIRNGHWIGSSGNMTYGGGGVLVDFSGNVSIDRCDISENVSILNGGGIFVGDDAQLTINRSTISRNTAAQGAGLANAGGDVTVLNSAITNNHAGSGGGGIYNSYGQTFVVNSTISGNTAIHNGGGINTYIDSVWLYNVTVVHNDSAHDRNQPGVGGGVYNTPGARLVATNSLIADNTSLYALIADDCNGLLEVYGWNLLVDDTGCSFSGNGIAARGQVSANTIGPLANNGGPTMTHALLAGSEAIDTTTAQGCVGPSATLLATDQRGAPRIAGSKCDVGAYEFGSAVPATDVVFSNGFD